MKLCAVIYRGQILEVCMVNDDHDFGEHGNHFHIECKVVEQHICHNKPLIWSDEDIGEELSDGQPT